MEGYNCFGCSPDNEAGVRMEFYEDGDEIVSIWNPRPEYQGWLIRCMGVSSPYCWMNLRLGGVP